MSTRAESFKRLAELASYPDAWDGPNSFSMASRTHDACLRVLAHLQEPLAQPELTLNENGTLTFEWFLKPYIYLEVGASRFALLIRDGDAVEMVNGENPELDDEVQSLLIPKLIGAQIA